MAGSLLRRRRLLQIHRFARQLGKGLGKGDSGAGRGHVDAGEPAGFGAELLAREYVANAPDREGVERPGIAQQEVALADYGNELEAEAASALFDAESCIGQAARDAGGHCRVGELAGVVAGNQSAVEVLALEKKVEQDARARAELSVDETHTRLREVGERLDGARVARRHHDALAARGEVDQHVAARIQPLAVEREHRGLQFAERRMEAREVAAPAHKGCDRLHAAAVLELDRVVAPQEELAHERDRIAVARMDAQYRPRVRALDLRLELRSQAVEQRRYARLDAPVGGQQLLAERAERGTATTRHVEHGRAEFLVGLPDQAPGVAVRDAELRGSSRDAAFGFNRREQFEQARKGLRSART